MCAAEPKSRDGREMKNYEDVPELADSVKGPSLTLQQWAACAAALLAVLAFWGGMLTAAQRYPSEYDWRYMTVSSLLSPSGDPAGYRWALWGVALSGLCGFCSVAIRGRRGRHGATEDRPAGIRALQVGLVCMVCSALVPQWLLGIPKGHEILALLAFAGLCVGIVRLTFHAVERTLLQLMRSSIGRARSYAAAVAGAAVLPVLFAALAQAYVFFALPELHWVGLSWRTLGVPMYFSLALWEWLTCVVLSTYIVILSLADLMVRSRPV